jgi:hypothetical protein
VLVTMFAAVIAVPAVAQTEADRAAVTAAVLDYVEGFYEGDSTRLVRSVWTDVRKYGYYRRGEGPYQGSAMPYAEFMQFANGVKAGRISQPEERPKQIELLDVQDQTAAAKLTAWWGTDYLLLARQDGRWKITHVLWQSRPAS